MQLCCSVWFIIASRWSDTLPELGEKGAWLTNHVPVGHDWAISLNSDHVRTHLFLSGASRTQRIPNLRCLDNYATPPYQEEPTASQDVSNAIARQLEFATQR